jgi:hypothetical protein
LGGGEAFIDGGDRKKDIFLDLGDKISDLLGRRAVGAVHISGKADDEGGDLMGLNQLR